MDTKTNVLVPMHEPHGEGNGWGTCRPTVATLWVIEDAAGNPIDAANTEAAARELMALGSSQRETRQ